jgi:signal transduction histidine kinase
MSEPTILIVDDTPENLDVLRQLLEDAGFRVRPADSGALALASLQRSPADLILLDIRMPNMDGYEVCRRLKADAATCDIPVIFLSALNDPLDKLKAFESGGVDYVSKPFDALEVLARVRTHLRLRELQQSLQQHNELLESEVARRTASLSEANAALEKALAAKRDFLSLMSHEFRTPLNGILGIASLLKSTLNGNQREYVEMLEHSGWHLLKLIENILQAAQQGWSSAPQENSPAALELDNFCRVMLQSVSALAEKKRIGMELQAKNLPRLALPMNSGRLGQILGNLLDNAIKFTPEGGQVGIEADYLADVEMLSLAVWDTGPGIPLDDRERIFQPFVQLEPLMSRRHEGAGLGLTLARNLAQLHGGFITVQGQAGAGSVFQLNLPARNAE